MIVHILQWQVKGWRTHRTGPLGHQQHLRLELTGVFPQETVVLIALSVWSAHRSVVPAALWKQTNTRHSSVNALVNVSWRDQMRTNFNYSGERKDETRVQSERAAGVTPDRRRSVIASCGVASGGSGSPSGKIREGELVWDSYIKPTGA